MTSHSRSEKKPTAGRPAMRADGWAPKKMVWDKKKLTGFILKKDFLGLKTGSKFVPLKDVDGYTGLEKYFNLLPARHYICVDSPAISNLIHIDLIHAQEDIFERSYFEIYLCNVFAISGTYRKWQTDIPVGVKFSQKAKKKGEVNHGN
jgi:hypothetical protein